MICSEDVELARRCRVQVAVKGQILLKAGELIQNFFNRPYLRLKIAVRPFAVAQIQVLAKCVQFMVTSGHTIRVDHRNEYENVLC